MVYKNIILYNPINPNSALTLPTITVSTPLSKVENMIDKISFKNFKLFKHRQILELRPITILIGKNNTGKTAAVKLPTLIAGCLNRERVSIAPLKLENEGVRIALSYEDLFYNREMTLETLEFGLETKSDQLEVVISGDRRYNISIKKYILNGQEINVKKNKFYGFTHKETPLGSLSLSFDYIEAFRKVSEAQFSDIYSVDSKIGTAGENAYKILAQYSENRDPILNDIKMWFKKHFGDWALDVKKLSGTSSLFEIVLSAPKLNNINIINTGSGIRQSLPLIVRSFMPVEDEILIIIEEPETHLHPGAHGDLAERFVDSYNDNNKRKYLIETHSENFILRIQRLIAENKISTQDVMLYYVDYDEAECASSLKKIVIEEDGEIEDWPDNIFNESLDEVLKLRQAQAKKNKNHAGKNSE